MASTRPKSCRVCGRSEREVGRISWQGLCALDGEAKMLQARHEIRAKSGPTFQLWRRNMAGSVGGVLVDGRPGRA